MAQFEVKLEPGDTRAALMEKKMRAERSFRQVSEEYHVVWLNCRDQSTGALAELEELKSLNLNGKIVQPPAAGVASSSEAYLDWLYASLERLQDRFGEFLQQLSQATGVEVKHAPLKNKNRVLEKAFYDYQGDYSRLVDICRGSGVAEDLAGVVRAMKWVLGGGQHCHVVRFKNRFCDGRRDIMARGGYRDILVNLELAGGAGGFVFELQIHLRPLFAMKEEAHKVLDLARAIIEPTLLKLSLLDAQESHVQLVHKVKQLELQVSGLIIEAAVQGQQQGQQGKQVGNNMDEDWKAKSEQLQRMYEQSQHEFAQLQQENELLKQKYEQSQHKGEQSQQKCAQLQREGEQARQTCEQLQQNCSLLEADVRRKDAELQTLKQQQRAKPTPPPPAEPAPEEKQSPRDNPSLAGRGWWKEPYVTGLSPPSFVLHGEALLARAHELISKIKLQPNDAIVFAHIGSNSLDETFAITQRELFDVTGGWNVPLSQIKKCARTGEFLFQVMHITTANGRQKKLLLLSEIVPFVQKILVFAALGIRT